MQINITPEQHELISRILTSYRSDLRDQIYRTETMSFKRGLKTEAELLDKVLQQLEEQQPAMAFAAAAAAGD